MYGDLESLGYPERPESVSNASLLRNSGYEDKIIENLKAGIGGPLLAFDGKFEGMNFYDEGAGGTPFLSCNAILNVLMHFKTKGTVDDVGHDTYQSHVLDWTIAGDNSVCINRWPVPKPLWCRRNDVDERLREIRIRRCEAILI
ncbi:hypothetical protein PR202_ga08216 [Eleusine coracana subsp. coracana]|uniref:Uncharacterized protein n=1 Tax=Eleusine coracana subsp. coracana TaxID=191504 RepID=A0AAV5C163_ELECO|nr:hypothetical protein PR202_ga08216 [Eleusine coracana subsp. coracana]